MNVTDDYRIYSNRSLPRIEARSAHFDKIRFVLKTSWLVQVAQTCRQLRYEMINFLKSELEPS